MHEARLQLATSTHSIEDMYSDSDAAFGSDEPDAEAGLLQVEDREELIHAIAALPERLQLVIKLHFIEELNLTEIAAILDISVPRVHQLKSSALDKLRLKIAGDSEDWSRLPPFEANPLQSDPEVATIASASPSTAIRIASLVLVTSSRAMRLARCASTVRGLMPRWRAIALLVP